MRERILRFLFSLLILGLTSAGYTNALFHSQTTILNNTFSTTCWVPPTIPQLIYPANGYLANLGSDWLANPYMDWSDSSTTCPGGVISYEYESYRDSGLTNLVYRSGLLSNSMIPAPGTPDGTYYWRVRAFDGTNWSGWSEVWLLTVDRSVPPPSPGSDNSPSGTPATSPPYSSAIVINEILPDPVGLDDAVKPDGEWVELYNRSDLVVDVAGWYLYDAIDSHVLPILGSRTDTGDTKIPAHGFLVVYRAGDSDFSLDQDAGGDTVRLYDSSILTGTLIDFHTYTGPVAEGKSIARYPDGIDTWYDPIPTPGGPNVLEVQPWPTPTPEVSPTAFPLPTPSLEFSLRNDKKAVAFMVLNVNAFEKINYEIVYDSNGGDKGIVGSAGLSGENTFSRNDLLLGICSGTEGKVCVYDQGITKISLQVTLTSSSKEKKILQKEINY